MQHLTALEILNRAALELGLQSFTEVAASTEVTGQQMLALLNAAGNDLLMAHPWSELNITYDFNTVASQASYDLPINYAYYIDQTMWNTSTQEHVAGPVTPQEWQQIRAGLVSISPDQLFRVQNNAMELYPTPSSVETVTYQYVSSNWVTKGSDTSVKQSSITADADIPILNSELLIKALKVKMWNAKGLDTGLLMAEYSELFKYLIGKDKGARVLSLSSRSGIAQSSVPDGNWSI